LYLSHGYIKKLKFFSKVLPKLGVPFLERVLQTSRRKPAEKAELAASRRPSVSQRSVQRHVRL